MKNRMLTFFFVLAATIATGQIDSGVDDKTKLLGSWGIHEIVNDGEIVMSLDPEKYQDLIDNAWMKDSVLIQKTGMDKAALMKSIKQQSEMLAKSTFVFGENGVVKVSTNDSKSKDVFSPYSIDVEKKELVIEEENGGKLKYEYMIFDDQLILIQENDKLIFKRKS